MSEVPTTDYADMVKYLPAPENLPFALFFTPEETTLEDTIDFLVRRLAGIVVHHVLADCGLLTERTSEQASWVGVEWMDMAFKRAQR